MSNKFITSLLSAITLFMISVTVYAQPLDSVLEKYSTTHQHEKAYLHYDKSYYFPGETIWFKTYIMESLFPAFGSKTFYVDWISDNGTVLYHSVCPLLEGVSNGQFQVPDNYTGNFIHVRAYTKWMLNFDTAFIYNKDIRIVNKTSTVKTTRPTLNTNLQFFPEGGDLVAGANNRIAFKASDQYGRPVAIKGVIQANPGAVLDSIKTTHDGMGSFYLIPQQNTSYIAKWKDESGKSFTTNIPTVKSTGIALQVGMNGAKRIITIFGGAEINPPMDQLHIIGIMNNKMAFKTVVQPKPNGSVSRVLPVEDLPSGIITITVFDNNWNAIAERISFIKNNDYSFKPSMEVKYWGLSKRKRNEIEITVPDSLGLANFSVSVTDAGIERDSSENIISHFLLSSEIKGRVNNPAYYFSNNSDKVARDLDLVMLTNGWRRFVWNDMLSGKFPPLTYAKDTTYLTLSGKVFGVTKSQLTGNESIIMMVKEKDTLNRMIIATINKDGTFSDPESLIFDSARIYYSLKSKFLKSAEAKFMTDRLPAPNYVELSKGFKKTDPYFDTTGLSRHLIMAAEAARLAALDRGKMMETVIVKAKQKSTIQQMDEKYASGMFRGADGYQFDLVNDPFANSALNIFNYLQGKVAGLQVSFTGGEYSLTWRGGSPGLFVDEVPTDVSMISGIPVTDVAYIKVIRPPFMGGFGGGNGAIAVYTKRGDDLRGTSSGLPSNTIVGYTQIKEFYSPNYDRFDPRNENKDIRTTIYWNPQVVTSNQKKKVLLTFYNNDISNSFRVVIEGMTREGLLTHYEEIME